MFDYLNQSVFDKSTDNLKFKKKETKNIASGTIDGEHVTIYYERKQFTIIIPNDMLQEEECRKIAKKILIELYKLLGIEISIEEIEIKMLGFASGICNYCLIKALTYKCRRCKGYYCSEHRLPENHNCPVDKQVEFEMKKKEKDKNKENKNKKSKEIVIFETHCG